jgi:hypothetical protein
MSRQLYVNNSNDVILKGLTKRSTGVADTTATLKFTLFYDGSAVTGAVDISMTWNSTNSEYFGTIPSTVDLVSGRRYLCVVTGKSTLSDDWDIYTSRYFTATDRSFR